MKVDFCTFCYSGDAHRLHSPGQLKRQVESNGYPFDTVWIIHQGCNPLDYAINNVLFPDCDFKIYCTQISEFDRILETFNIDFDKLQYQSPTDRHHQWKYHVVNHLAGIQRTSADYVVFADSDCWMVSNPSPGWVVKGIEALQQNPDIFIVSPNDGEPERKTQTMSQQMFLVKVEDFRQADFNQPGYSGNPQDYPEMPEYHAMLEGRMSYYCRSVGRYRYVLPGEYRYWHWNRTRADGMLETDMSKY